MKQHHKKNFSNYKFPQMKSRSHIAKRKSLKFNTNLRTVKQYREIKK